MNEVTLTACHPCDWGVHEDCLDGMNGDLYVECLCDHRSPRRVHPSNTSSGVLSAEKQLDDGQAGSSLSE